MSTVTLTGHGGLDVTDFRGFGRALRRAEPKLARGLRTRLRAGGELVAAQARANISPYSQSIPPTSPR